MECTFKSSVNESSVKLWFR